MSAVPPVPGKLLQTLIQASAGSQANYRIAVYGQAILGSLYALGHFDLKLAGGILGWVLPMIWVVCTYRLLKEKAEKHPVLPFPSWIKKEPGNTLIIFLDGVFLSLIWFFILSGLYDRIWIRVLFTVVFPLLTLAMLRNLFLYPPEENPAGT
jgi:hypothetical protein